MNSIDVSNLFDIQAPVPVRMGVKPTRLEYRPDVGGDLNIELFLKREDQIDDFGCGNKLRKLSYIATDALMRNATVLVTAGSLPSNQCKAVSILAALQGLRAHLIYGGDKQARPAFASGNYLLTTLLEPTVTWLEFSPWQEIEIQLEKVAEKERTQGERPYIIPPGASAWPGLLGSIELGLELSQQLPDPNLPTDVIAPAGSGGTCLGIQIAADRLRLPWRVFGICIGESGKVLIKHSAALREETERRLNMTHESSAELIFDDCGLGGGYDNPQQDEIETQQTVMIRYQLLFDLNYMIKAFMGMRSLISNGTILRGARVVFVHTGGQTEIMGGSALRDWYSKRYPSWVRTNQ